MPPAKPKHHLLRDWIKPFPEGIYTTDGKIIFCQPCGKKVLRKPFAAFITFLNFQIQCSIKSHLTQHNESDKHSENFERFQKTATRQQFLAFSQTENVDPLSKDLCNAFVGANIPSYKVNNPSFNDFLSKYCNRSVPVESTLRNNYLKVCYEEIAQHFSHVLMAWESIISSLIVLILPLAINVIAPKNTVEEWSRVFIGVPCIQILAITAFVLFCDSKPRKWTGVDIDSRQSESSSEAGLEKY